MISRQKRFEVLVTYGTIRPRGGVRAPFTRIFTVYAHSKKAAIKAVRDAGIRADRIEVIDSNPTGLYQAFHGNPPARTRRVHFDVPKRAIKIGRLIALQYAPEPPSRLAGRRFEHEFGDYGTLRFGKHKPILAVSPGGKQLLVLNELSDYKFESRGIVG